MLIFCFRLPTAEVLRDLITVEIEKRTRGARRADGTHRLGAAGIHGPSGARICETEKMAVLTLNPDDLRQIAKLAARAREWETSHP